MASFVYKNVYSSTVSERGGHVSLLDKQIAISTWGKLNTCCYCLVTKDVHQQTSKLVLLFPFVGKERTPTWGITKNNVFSWQGSCSGQSGTCLSTWFYSLWTGLISFWDLYSAPRVFDYRCTSLIISSKSNILQLEMGRRMKGIPIELLVIFNIFIEYPLLFWITSGFGIFWHFKWWTGIFLLPC